MVLAQTFAAGGGAAQDTLRIGMSAAFTGPSGSLGRDMRLGIEAHFAEVNRAGGIGGRPIALVSRDDGYVAREAAANMRALIREDRVLAVLGNVGTPTADSTVHIAMADSTLMFGST